MSNDQPGRRQKVVMVLGIAAIILFSANLLTALAHHFWPNLAFNTENTQSVAELAPLADVHALAEVRVEHRPHRRHKIVIRHRADRPPVVATEEFGLDIDLSLEIAQLQAEIERELSELDVSLDFEKAKWDASLEDAQHSLEQAERHLKRIKIKHVADNSESR